MKIICIKGFRDKTTAKRIEDQTKIVVGQILECEDKLALERIEKGLCKEYKEPIEEVFEEVIEEIINNQLNLVKNLIIYW